MFLNGRPSRFCEFPSARVDLTDIRGDPAQPCSRAIKRAGLIGSHLRDERSLQNIFYTKGDPINKTDPTRQVFNCRKTRVTLLPPPAGDPTKKLSWGTI